MSLNPKKIVDEDRRCGYVTVTVTLGAFLTYAAVTIMQAIEARGSPPVQLSTEVEIYTQPSYTICPAEGILWTPVHSTVLCQEQADDADEATGFRFERCAHAFLAPSATPMGQACVTFHANRTAELDSRQDELIFGVNFFVSYDFSNTKGNGVAQRLLLYVHEDEWNPDDPPIRIPFTAATYVQVAKTERTYLSSEPETEYQLSATSAEIQGFLPSSTTGNETVEVHVALQNFVVTSIAEIDPMDPLNLFGVISGVWGLVGFIIGVMFTDLDDSPQYRARFRKAAADAAAASAAAASSPKAGGAAYGARKERPAAVVTKDGTHGGHTRLDSPPAPNSPEAIEMGHVDGLAMRSVSSRSNNRIYPE